MPIAVGIDVAKEVHWVSAVDDQGEIRIDRKLDNTPAAIAALIASALIGASNFFELAVATAIGLFGFNSGAALATVVGVLVEVPVMLSVVRITMRSKAWYERAR